MPAAAQAGEVEETQLWLLHSRGAGGRRALCGLDQHSCSQDADILSALKRSRTSFPSELRRPRSPHYGSAKTAPQRAHRFATSDRCSESDPLARKTSKCQRAVRPVNTAGLSADGASATEVLCLPRRRQGGHS